MERAEELTEKTGFKGWWYVVTGVAGRHIVRTLKNEAEVRAIHLAGGVLDVEEVFEFSSQLQINQVQNPHNPKEPMMNIGKMNLAHRLDATLFPVNAGLSLQGALVYNLNNLKEADVPAYKEQIQGAVKLADGWHKERVRASSGIELTGGMPPGGFRGVGVPGLKL